MGERTAPPWSDEQVAALNAYQSAGRMHPFTCANRGDGKHRTTSDLGVLIATRDGWVCPDCDYTQAWAHEFMLDPEMGKPFDIMSIFDGKGRSSS